MTKTKGNDFFATSEFASVVPVMWPARPTDGKAEEKELLLCKGWQVDYSSWQNAHFEMV